LAFGRTLFVAAWSAWRSWNWSIVGAPSPSPKYIVPSALPWDTMKRFSIGVLALLASLITSASVVAVVTILALG